MARVYYNEFDPMAAEWLRYLMVYGLIPMGDVDERSIVDVQPDDLKGYDQCHFFAGIGGWPYALSLAGWGDRPVWTGSCPCQPFSAAGKQKGEKDERHLWPEFFRLIAQCRPAVIFGEQVASKLGREWLGGSAGLLRLRRAEAVIRVLRRLQPERRLPPRLQDLLAYEREKAAGCDPGREAFREEQGAAPQEAGDFIGELGSIPGEPEGHGMQHSGREHSGADRRGGVRGNGAAVQSGRGQDLGQSFAGQDRLREGLHEREHASRDLRAECDGECLGREPDSECCGRDAGSEAGEVERIAAEVERETESLDVHGQFAGVFADLESVGYAVAGADLCAAGCGAPHIRQRLWWVADADQRQRGRLADGEGCDHDRAQAGRQQGDCESEPRCAGSGVADADSERRVGEYPLLRPEEAGRLKGGFSETARGSESSKFWLERRGLAATSSERGGMGNADDEGPQGRRVLPERADERSPWAASLDCWLPCADGKARRIEPGIAPLAHGVPGRVAQLRGLGNAIVPQVAAAFVEAFLDSE